MKVEAFNQPKVFWLSSLTTVCERFGFYVLTYLLVLFTKSEFGLSDTAAFSLFAIFNALVYMMPALGGYLADNVFGIRRSIILGLFMEGTGLALLSVPSKFVFYAALSLVIIGVGYFKTAPTNLMARAYKENDPRIDSGFTLFYMAINIGSFLAPLIAGFLSFYIGWRTSFLLASIVIYSGLIVYYLMRKSARGDDSEVGRKRLNLFHGAAIIAVTGVSCIVVAWLIVHSSVSRWVFATAALILLGYFFFETIRSSREDKLKIIACLSLIGIGFLYFILCYQQYMSINLFIDRCVDREIFGHTIPTTEFMMANPFWVLVLSPVLAYVYGALGEKKKDLAVTAKFFLGVLVTSLCFFALVLSTYFAASNGKVSGWWIVLAMGLYTLGELLISALGVAMVTRIAPKRMYGVMMGAWFLIAASLSSLFSGTVASWASVPSFVLNPQAVLGIYNGAFLKMGLFGLGSAVIALAICPIIKKIAKL